MRWYKETLHLRTISKGMLPITTIIEDCLHQWPIQEGICHLYLQHTSASLVINESYDSTAQNDMETFLEKLVPPSQPWMEHTLEGSDDSTSHLRTLLTNTSLSIPIENGSLCLGNWQGIYLFEHRDHPHNRRILVRVLSIEEGEIA
jgi:secondary thiamine-phosphate synthase enzyme